MTKRTFKKFADLAKYRVSMKRTLRKHGIEFDNGTTTERLEELTELLEAPRAAHLDGVVKRALEG
ncbi:MAG: hypothetical protein JRJ40_11310 [Deltaproteobacteria bacterium]|nr:hypothetical protein [Deltaproteobacteria bacterium]